MSKTKERIFIWPYLSDSSTAFGDLASPSDLSYNAHN